MNFQEVALTEVILFVVFALVGIAGGLGLILFRNPVYSATSLILNMFSIAGLYLTLHSQFLAIIQIIVYAGAIMVLFLFVIMLLNLSTDQKEMKYDPLRGVGVIVGVIFAAEMLYIFKSSGTPLPQTEFTFGSVENIGRVMMTEYLFPFEMISVVLLSALVGAIVIAKRTNA